MRKLNKSIFGEIYASFDLKVSVVLLIGVVYHLMSRIIPQIFMTWASSESDASWVKWMIVSRIVFSIFEPLTDESIRAITPSFTKRIMTRLFQYVDGVSATDKQRKMNAGKVKEDISRIVSDFLDFITAGEYHVVQIISGIFNVIYSIVCIGRPIDIVPFLIVNIVLYFIVTPLLKRKIDLATAMKNERHPIISLHKTSTMSSFLFGLSDWKTMLKIHSEDEKLNIAIWKNYTHLGASVSVANSLCFIPLLFSDLEITKLIIICASFSTLSNVISSISNAAVWFSKKIDTYNNFIECIDKLHHDQSKPDFIKIPRKLTVSDSGKVPFAGDGVLKVNGSLSFAEQAKVVVLSGPSGYGKSTFADAIGKSDTLRYTDEGGDVIKGILDQKRVCQCPQIINVDVNDVPLGELFRNNPDNDYDEELIVKALEICELTVKFQEWGRMAKSSSEQALKKLATEKNHVKRWKLSREAEANTPFKCKVAGISGGELRKLHVAFTFVYPILIRLKQGITPFLLILDEIDSGSDFKNSVKLHQNFIKAFPQSNVIIISHFSEFWGKSVKVTKTVYATNRGEITIN